MEGLIFLVPVAFIGALVIGGFVLLRASRATAQDQKSGAGGGGFLPKVLWLIACVCLLGGIVLGGAAAIAKVWPVAVGYAAGGVAMAALFSAVAKVLSNSERIMAALAAPK